MGVVDCCHQVVKREFKGLFLRIEIRIAGRKVVDRCAKFKRNSRLVNELESGTNQFDVKWVTLDGDIFESAQVTSRSF